MKSHLYRQFVMGVVVLILSICCAQASTLPYEDFQVVTGNSISATSIQIAQVGTYKASLVDAEFLAPFDILMLGIVSEDLNVLGFSFGTGSFTFEVPAPGDIYALLAAIPGSAGTGAYGVQIAAVPIPTALLLFASALIGLAMVGRRNDV